MAFKILRFLKIGRYFRKARTKKVVIRRRRVWQGISHGFHAVERSDETEDLVLAQREQIEGMELWLFGVFDKDMGYPLRKYMQSNIINKRFNVSQIERKAIVAMKNSYLITEGKIHEGEKHGVGGFATALVMQGEKFVAAQFGRYKAVLSRDGVATQIGELHQRHKKRNWISKDMLRMKCLTGNSKSLEKCSKLIVTTQHVEPEYEFIILASDGIWEVMGCQEAVDLINQIEDAQTAAKVLAGEAMTRMSKSTVSCVVIRFHS